MLFATVLVMVCVVDLVLVSSMCQYAVELSCRVGCLVTMTLVHLSPSPECVEFVDQTRFTASNDDSKQSEDGARICKRKNQYDERRREVASTTTRGFSTLQCSNGVETVGLKLRLAWPGVEQEPSSSFLVKPRVPPALHFLWRSVHLAKDVATRATGQW